MRKKSASRRRRDDSDSDSSSSESEISVERPQDLFKQLKNALMDRSGSVHRTIYKLQKHYKESVGILRIATSDKYSFNQGDMEQFFKKFGKIEKIVLKQHANKNVSEDQLKAKEGQSLSYVIYSQYCSAILAMKVLNSVSEKERIFNAKICHNYPVSSEAKLFCQPLIGYEKTNDMIIEVQKDYEFGDLTDNFKFVGTIGLDITDRDYRLKELYTV